MYKCGFTLSGRAPEQTEVFAPKIMKSRFSSVSEDLGIWEDKGGDALEEDLQVPAPFFFFITLEPRVE